MPFTKRKQRLAMENITIRPHHVLFFDLDDTLVDTNHANFLAYQSAFLLADQCDFHVTYDPSIRFNRKIFQQIFPDMEESVFRKIIQLKEKQFQSTNTHLNTQMADILRKYSKTHQTVLVTDCNENRAKAIISHHKLLEYFSDLLFGRPENNTEENKYQYAIRTLNIPPASIIVFENDEQNIAAAQEIGITQIINPKKINCYVL